MATAAQPSQNRNKVGDVAITVAGNTYASINSSLALVNNLTLKNAPTYAAGAAAVVVGAAFASPIGLGVAGALALKVAFEAVMVAGKTYKESYKKVESTFRPNRNAPVERPQQTNRAPENTAEQRARVQMPQDPIAKSKEEEQIRIVVPTAQQPEQKQTNPQTTIEIDVATPEQVTKAKAATLETPLDTILGAAQQGADEKIARSVRDVNALLVQTKTNAQGIDAKIDAAMGKSPTDEDVMRSLNKFTTVLSSNMQKRGIVRNDNKGTEANQIRIAQAVQDSMRQAGAYTLTTKATNSAGLTFELKTPLVAGKIGRNIGNAANYAMNGVEPNFNNQEALMNKAAALSAIQNQPSFQDENGKFNPARVAEAFGNGGFDSFKNSDDKRNAALYDAAKMVTEQYKEQVQLKENAQVQVIELVQTTVTQTVVQMNAGHQNNEVIDVESTTIPSAKERLALPPAKETTPTAQDDRGGEELANELQTAIAVRQLQTASR